MTVPTSFPIVTQASKRLAVLLASFLLVPSSGCLLEQMRPTKTSVPVGLHPTKVMVVGTIHKMHLVDKNYPMQVLAGLIEEWNPDLVLVEMSPKALAQGAWEQGPIEASYVVWVARHAHIPVEGIGIHDRARCKAKARAMAGGIKKMLSRQRHMKPSQRLIDPKAVKTEKMVSMLPASDTKLLRSFLGLMPPGFEQAHSVRFERLQRMVRNAMLRSAPKKLSAVLHQEAVMAHAAAQAIRAHHAARVLVIVGLCHRLALADHLAGLGARLVDPVSLLAARGLKGRSYLARPISQQVVDMWQNAVSHIDEKLAEAAWPLNLMLSIKKRCFEIAIARSGRCCVSRYVFMQDMENLVATLRAGGPAVHHSPKTQVKPVDKKTTTSPKQAPAPPTTPPPSPRKESPASEKPIHDKGATEAGPSNPANAAPPAPRPQSNP